MIPFCEIDASAELPEGASFWMPSPRELEEKCESGEGSFGYFHDTWILGGFELSEAKDLVDEERKLLRLADQYSRSPREFEEIVSLLEGPEVADYLPSRLADTELWEAMLDPTGADREPPFYGLELGVAGLSVTLSSLGFVPVASCRSHHDRSQPSWSQVPVVYLCTTRAAGEWLSPLARRTGCGFSINEDRPDALVIKAPSVEHSISLAEAIIRESGTAPAIVLSGGPGAEYFEPEDL
ncbi:hypothetical protein AB0G05_42645 [Nonomuraea wenchangensis]